MIASGRIVAVAPAAQTYAVELTKQMSEAGIMANQNRAAMFLGQIAHESGGFKVVRESLNYSATALKALFGRHRISLEECDRFGRTDSHPANQEALANRLYGGTWGARALGNTQPGDGWRFRGRGLKQLTGRDNYARFSQHWLGDNTLLVDPDRVARPDGAVASAIWFWMARRLNEIADRGDVAAVTQIVNGGLIGLDSRKMWTERFREAWNPDPFANVVSLVTSTETPND